MSKYLVTGGAGFIGSHFCRMALKHNWCTELLNLDSLTYAGNLANLSEIADDPRYRFQRIDIGSPDLAALIKKEKPDAFIHFAAESHVDRSIVDPTLFLKTNVLGTFNCLRAFLDYRETSTAKNPRFLFISTDEVYGSLGPTGEFYETTPFAPRSPYSVSKASADQLTSAYFHTYGLNTVIVRCSNNYGPHQFPEKLIPQTTLFALQGRKIPVYGTGTNVRDWIYVEDFARGIYAALNLGKAGEAYNFGGQSEATNLDIVKRILSLTGAKEDLIEFVTDRKGHDFRYAMNFEKSKKELGWTPQVRLLDGLQSTVEWYKRNEDWWRSIFSGAYKDFFEKYYGQDLKAAGQK